MSYSGLLRHDLTLLTPPDPDNDDWDSIPTWAEGSSVRGLVQDRSGEAIEGPDLGGTLVANAVIFLPAGTSVTEQHKIRREDTQRVYRILHVRDAAGQGHHIELAAKLVEPVPAEEAS
jgi:hypothetical protein